MTGKGWKTLGNVRQKIYPMKRSHTDPRIIWKKTLRYKLRMRMNGGENTG